MAIITPLKETLAYYTDWTLCDNVANVLEERCDAKTDDDDPVYDYTSIAQHLLDFIRINTT